MDYYSPATNKFTTGQMDRLIDLMGELQSLGNGKPVYPDGMNRQQFWKRIASELNGVDGGAQKNAAKWCKTWFDWKAKTKKKAKVLQQKRSKGEEQKYPLTRLEKRLMVLMGYPVKICNTDENIAVEPKMEYVEGVFTASMKQSDSEEETLLLATSSRHADFFEEASGDEVYSSKSKGKRNSKRSRTEAPPPRTEQDRSFNETLERERLRQRDEELRLKAVELKLREDELKLKETELSKIDALAGVEEEKLKCFRDVVGLLRELVDRTKNGNPNLLRYHNNL